MRRLPPMSDPSSSGVIPVASAAAAPPEDPPGVRFEVPRVGGPPVHRIVGLVVAREIGRVGLAPDHRSSRPQPRHRCCIRRLGGALGIFRRAGSCRHALDVERVLDGDRQAVQRPGACPGLLHPVELARPRAGGAEIGAHHGVDRGVYRLAARDMRFQQVDGARLAAGKPVQQRPRRGKDVRRLRHDPRLLPDVLRFHQPALRPAYPALSAAGATIKVKAPARQRPSERQHVPHGIEPGLLLRRPAAACSAPLAKIAR